MKTRKSGLFYPRWLVCLALTVCIAGCGGDGGDDDPPPPPPTDPVQALVWDDTDWDEGNWQ